MKFKAFCGMLALAALGSGYFLLARPTAVRAPAPVELPKMSEAPKPLPAPKFRLSEVRLVPQARPEADLENAAPVAIQTGLEEGLLRARFVGNGRDRLIAHLSNARPVDVRVRIPAGLVFESGKTLMVLVRSADCWIGPSKSLEVVCQTVAPQSSNPISETDFVLTKKRIGRLEVLLDHAASHVELPLTVLQTVTLALTENLPLSAVARFSPAAPEVKSRFNTDAFRVDSGDLVSALIALREMGIAEESIAMSIDPQLKIEAMIEPLSRAAAMHYYGITPETEWSYWKNELLFGPESTRHYALYGIARFYPEVALEMLPKWAREVRTNNVYRLAAIQALPDTLKPEALTILKQLATELDAHSELGRAATGSAEYLKQRLSRLSSRHSTVGFRLSQATPGL